MVVFTKENGKKHLIFLENTTINLGLETNDMDEVFKFGRMDQFMKVIGVTIKQAYVED